MPYNKRHEDCTNASGEKGTFVTIKKEDGKRQCWKSEAAFKRALAARHANESYSREEVMEAVHEVLEEYYNEEVLDEEQLEEKKRCWNKSPECGNRDYSKEKPTAGDEKNKQRKRDRRKAEKQGRVKNGDGKDVSHIGGINGKTVIKDKSDNRGSKTDGPGDRRARGGKSNK